MKRIFWFTLASLSLAFSSCNLLSLYPLYTDEVLVRDDRIEGEWLWRVDSSAIQWSFQAPESGEGFTYHLRVTDPEDGEQEGYDIRLVKLEDTYYFDVFPGTQEGLLLTDLLACHTFGKVEIADDQITYYPFDYDWLEDLFEQRKIRLRHETPQNKILLTASPEELQKFLLKYGNDEKAYLDPIILKRPV
jgi:hypothetical protein